MKSALIVTAAAGFAFGSLLFSSCDAGTLIGVYVIAGLLVIAALDYRRAPRRRAGRPPVRLPAPRISEPDTWTCHTQSA